MAAPLLSPRGLFPPEPDYFRSERPRPAAHVNRNPAASPDLSSLPRHTFPTQVEDDRLANLSGVTRASLLEVRPAAATVTTGIAALDALTSGIPRGALTEIYGPASSGRSSVQLALLAEMTRRQEVCALVDVSDSFDPHSAAASGVDLERVLWIRCVSTELRVPSSEYSVPSTQKNATDAVRASRKSLFRALEQALKATDLLLQSGGFGLIAVDLGDIPPQIARRVPLTSWFRFRRAVENTPTILLVMEQEPYAKTCASLVLKMYPQSAALRDQVPTAELPTHARLLRGLGVTAEVVRSRTERKPSRSVAAFEMQTMWVRSRVGPSGDRAIG
jgi:recombination protein RecA